jgi:hypothetical protein
VGDWLIRQFFESPAIRASGSQFRHWNCEGSVDAGSPGDAPDACDATMLGTTDGDELGGSEGAAEGAELGAVAGDALGACDGIMDDAGVAAAAGADARAEGERRG